MFTHKYSAIGVAFIAALAVGTGAMIGGTLMGDITGVPTCNGVAATIYVDGMNMVVGGPDNGKTFKGTLNGTAEDDIIIGTDGNDKLHGKKGNDVICGGAGDDTISGDDGSDVLFGEAGNDRIDGNQDDDQLFGGDGDDNLGGGGGADILEGNSGADRIDGNQASDRILGGAGNDTIDGGDGADTLCGNADDDSVSGHQDDDEIDGGPGTDALTGNTGTDVCRNGEANTDCEDTAEGFIALCGDSAPASSSSSSQESSESSSVSSDASSSSTLSSEEFSSSSALSSESSSTDDSSESSASSESSTSSIDSESSSSHIGDATHWSADAPAAEATGGGGGGGGGGEEFPPIFRGHGLAEHASALDFVLSSYDLQPESTYSFGTEQTTPTPLLSVEDTTRTVRVHAAACSMYRYFKQLLIARPHTSDDYIDWIAMRMADAIGEDPEHMKAALLGRPHSFEDYSDRHTHVDNLDEQGCAQNAYVFDAPEQEAAVEDTIGPVHMHLDQSHLMETTTLPTLLHVHDESTDTDLAFSIQRGDEVFTDFGNSLSKEMHLIIARDDLQYFYHVHPERDALGVWRIPFIPDAGGIYWIYANFVESDGHAYALRFSRTYAGETGVSEATPDFTKEKIISGYRVRLIAKETDTGMSFTYAIRDAAGERVELEHFMGAFGHSVMLSKDGYFVHSHPSIRANGDPTFYMEAPPEGTYRIFSQFVIDGVEHTFVFDWQR